MEVPDELQSFGATGIYRLESAGTGAVFLDPVRLLNESYQRFCVVPSAYYSRSFLPPRLGSDEETAQPEERRKRKRNRKPKPKELNAMEQIAEARHQEARPLLLSAHESLLKAKHLLDYLSNMVKVEDHTLDVGSSSENNFVELGSSWLAPFYEITVCYQKLHDLGQEEEGSFHVQKTSFPLFNSVISVDATDEAEGEFQNRRYILPRGSCFLMTDIKHVRNLIPGNPNQGYNLIVIDPPWENGCVRQKEAPLGVGSDIIFHLHCVLVTEAFSQMQEDSRYPTLPNRYFLYLPVQELAHPAGALVVLWITNREKLRVFIEQELFPSWGVKDATIFYWLKVKSDGSLIGDLDLFHHRPYECLLLGYINVDTESKRGSNFKILKDSQVIMSVPGAHSRKPPLQKLLSDYIPGPKAPKCIELFARELSSGWTSWGNEALHFQDSIYFSKK